MEVNVVTAIVSIVTLIVSVAATFYVKDYLEKRSEYSKLKKKLEKIAGKRAFILYPGVGFGPQLFKIVDIDQRGVTLQNELQIIFVPAAKLIQSEVILPCDDFEKAKLAKMKKDFEDISDAIFPALFEKMIPAFIEVMRDQIEEDEGEISAVIGFKIQKVLKEEGFEIKKLKDS